MKRGWIVPEIFKNRVACVIFGEPRGAHRPPSGAGTLAVCSSVAYLPQCPARVAVRQRQGVKMEEETLANGEGREEREKLR